VFDGAVVYVSRLRSRYSASGPQQPEISASQLSDPAGEIETYAQL
jgi:hypothetical protein